MALAWWTTLSTSPIWTPHTSVEIRDNRMSHVSVRDSSDGSAVPRHDCTKVRHLKVLNHNTELRRESNPLLAWGLRDLSPAHANVPRAQPGHRRPWSSSHVTKSANLIAARRDQLCQHASICIEWTPAECCSRWSPNWRKGPGTRSGATVDHQQLSTQRCGE